jgi:murein L,D-transpeptidase YcbB/YkuD
MNRYFLIHAMVAISFSWAAAAFALPFSCQGEVNMELCTLLQTGRLADLHWPTFSSYQLQADNFYRRTHYQLAWTVNGHPTRQAKALIQSLQAADKEGLFSTDYDGPKWTGRLFRLAHPSAPSTSELAHFDLALTISVMRFISDLHCGHPNSQRQVFGSNPECRDLDLAEFVRNRLLRASNVYLILSEAEPPYEGYHRTRMALQHYLSVQEIESGLPADADEPVNPGDQYPFLAKLARHLKRLGDLSQDQQVPADSSTYDGVLVEAVKHFQLRHGLTPDGIIDHETIRQLTMPVSQRILQLRLALERWRWLPRDLPSRFLLVNIPEFLLTAFDHGHRSFTMKIIVGEASQEGENAENHRTPMFQGRLESIIFFPYWNVPAKIAMREIIPATLMNPEYLTNHQYQLVNRRGEVITPHSVDQDLSRRILEGEVQIRQKPGPDNSLGSAKFVFRNPYGVYIHGTPEQELFSYERRDFSHGCIRVEDPTALAEWVLLEQNSEIVKQIRAIAKSDPEAYRVALSPISVSIHERIPVLIFYQTAVVEEDNQVHFFEDIYGLDNELSLVFARDSWYHP